MEQIGLRRPSLWLAVVAVCGMATLVCPVGVWQGGRAWAQDLTFSSSVDKTTANTGDPITLTITLSGDIAGITLPPPQFPEGFVVAGQSQTTNFSIHGGAAERAVSLIYVLVPQQPGSFTVGPFHLTHQGREMTTEPITLTINKRLLPPNLKPSGGRFLL